MDLWETGDLWEEGDRWEKVDPWRKGGAPWSASGGEPTTGRHCSPLVGGRAGYRYLPHTGQG